MTTKTNIEAVNSGQTREDLPEWFDAFLTNVCEIPDRNSPDDEPEAIVATLEELKSCALNAIEQCSAANVAIGEREALLPMETIVREWLIKMGLYNSVNRDQRETLEAFGDFVRETDAYRAALTAEKVAGPVAVYPQGVMGIPPYSPPGSGSVTVEPGISRNVAPQHPAQPVAQTLALTDEQRSAVVTAIKAMTACGWTHRIPALAALLAAQPASSLPPVTDDPADD